MLKGVEQSARLTCEKIAEITTLMEKTTDYSNLVERNFAKRQTASIYLKQLVDVGILQEIVSG